MEAIITTDGSGSWPVSRTRTAPVEMSKKEADELTDYIPDWKSRSALHGGSL